MLDLDFERKKYLISLPEEHVLNLSTIDAYDRARYLSQEQVKFERKRFIGRDLQDKNESVKNGLKTACKPYKNWYE